MRVRITQPVAPQGRLALRISPWGGRGGPRVGSFRFAAAATADPVESLKVPKRRRVAKRCSRARKASEKLLGVTLSLDTGLLGTRWRKVPGAVLQLTRSELAHVDRPPDGPCVPGTGRFPVSLRTLCRSASPSRPSGPAADGSSLDDGFLDAPRPPGRLECASPPGAAEGPDEVELFARALRGE